MSVETDILSHIGQQISELKRMYEYVKAEYFSFDIMTDASPSPLLGTNYREVIYHS